MNRQQFLRHCALATSGALLIPATGNTQTEPKPQAIVAEKVKEFVTVGHSNFEKVKQLYEEIPSLIFAAWDWGGGDFETALEAAGHVGNKEIANFLIDKGARVNLFVLTMLGKTSLVKSYLDTYPSYVFAKGPHGLSLLHHAQKGGEEAKELLDYLHSKGLKETRFKI